MKKLSLLLLAAAVSFTPARNINYTPAELAAWQAQAAKITIIRDDWGIAHVYGHTDADAVFGAIYAQAEDDFNRIETNYMTNLGRTAIAEGETAIWKDLRAKLFINDDSLKAYYKGAPQSLKVLMDAWADGLNFYLAKHPDVHPKSIQKFEPWMALSFTEGSIGGDFEKVQLNGLQQFYGHEAPSPKLPAPTEEDLGFPPDPGGSNGMAVSPKNTTVNHALLLINPHTSFFFRSELQMVSDEGLNVYGASTWGQFFIYQGFNEKAGWMHTSSSVDATDEFLETVTKSGDHWTYKHGDKQLPVRESVVTIPYKTATGMAEKKFTVYYTMHGPVTHADANGKWVSFAAMNEPVKALTQSYTRTKAHNLAEYKKNFDLHTNSSNNTLFADASGNIAYFHANYIPRRDVKFDWRQPVDGSDPATDYKGLLSFDESPNVINPSCGWVYNTNNSPWTASGACSLKQDAYPKYVDNGSESARSAHAIRVLENKKDFTLDGLRLAAFDSYQGTYFEKPLSALFAAYDAAPASPLKTKIAEQIGLLKKWDMRWGAKSVETSLAICWAEDLQRSGGRGGRGRGAGGGAAAALDSAVIRAQMLQSVANASDKLTTDFGSWKTGWGEINRFQRLTDDIVHPFADSGPSIPVMFSTANFGSLASFATRQPQGMKKRYGQSGNSFVAVVEFGDSVRAKAVTAGGESGDPRSKHFNDQAERYSTGNLRDVYFYRAQLKGHTEREYHPGG